MKEKEHIAFKINELIDLYGDLIYRLAFQNMQNRFDAEDITQDVIIKLYKKMPTYDCITNKKAWIIRIVLNTCKDHWRYHKRHTTVAYIEQMDQPLYEEKDYGLIYEVKKLPMNYRNIIYLYYYEGYSTKEIAAIMKKKERTIATWLHRARKQLKINLEEEVRNI